MYILSNLYTFLLQAVSKTSKLSGTISSTTDRINLVDINGRFRTDFYKDHVPGGQSRLPRKAFDEEVVGTSPRISASSFSLLTTARLKWP
jgi:hypothetical protein